MPNHRYLAGLMAVIVLAGCSADSAPTAVITPIPTPPADTTPAPPPALVGTWTARAAAGATLPYVVERFPDWPAPPSVHEIQLDHGRLELTSDGRYQLRVLSSEWGSANPAAGTEFILHFRFSDHDFGTWKRQGDHIVLTSEWIQHRVTHGTVLPDGSLQLRHGLVWGDPELQVQYGRSTT